MKTYGACRQRIHRSVEGSAMTMSRQHVVRMTPHIVCTLFSVPFVNLLNAISGFYLGSRPGVFEPLNKSIPPNPIVTELRACLAIHIEVDIKFGNIDLQINLVLVIWGRCNEFCEGSYN